MKKIILSAVAIFAFGVASAQIKTDAGTFTKPTSGTWIMEATMTPDLTGGGIFKLSSVGNSDLGILGVKARKFSSDTKALRLAGNLQVLNSGEKITGTDDNAPAEFTVAVGVGIENHMKGAERLSTYWGYEGSLAYVSQNARGAADEILDDKSTKIGFGANVFTGFDYYIMPKIYLGAEVSYGLAFTSSKAGEDADNVTRIELSPSITPSFRIGWQF
ncbi:BT1926 family outer membrane beta-barrel protein [Flavobacterium sp.]|uniref:BT1926 family outer membrane beta-barrel protein n=1 Tax=Flavobacterium sp. TaxID=239 RepID=UPI00286CFB92|nr:BT1926 family outer membrane beta-barrel protein [Flavobacterium sp.]